MIYGFTGTRRGMTERQKLALAEIFSTVLYGATGFNHGGCRGADREAHDIAAYLACRVVHPAIGDDSWESRTDYSTLLPAKPPLVRNHDVVDASDVLIAAPKSLKEELRSGTWATIRYARKIGKPVLILDP